MFTCANTGSFLPLEFMAAGVSTCHAELRVAVFHSNDEKSYYCKKWTLARLNYLTNISSTQTILPILDAFNLILI